METVIGQGLHIKIDHILSRENQNQNFPFLLETHLSAAFENYSTLLLFLRLQNYSSALHEQLLYWYEYCYKLVSQKYLYTGFKDCIHQSSLY